MKVLAIRTLTVALALWLVTAHASSALVAPPYLQLGHAFAQGGLEVVWHTPKDTAGWRAEWRDSAAAPWSAAPASRQPWIDRDVWTAALRVGRTGGAFDYRILHEADVVATGRGRAPRGGDGAARFVVVGDFGDGSDNQRALTRRLIAEHRRTPIDFGLIPGDVVYHCGRRDEYNRNFFSVLNPADGDALLREVPFAATVGNHDVGDLRWPPWPFRCSSDFSFFTFWRQPQGFADVLPTGPDHEPPSPPEAAAVTDVRRLLSSANFSFSWGATHVTVLDSNRYVDWSDPALRRWLDRDLAAAGASRWRFVLFHHPPFNLSRDHAGDQWPRYLVPIFERHRVTAVFSGHVHNFQWFGPVHFTPDAADVRRYEAGARGRFRGAIEVQAGYDGATSTLAQWPVYIVSGAGGGALIRESRRCPPNLAAPGGCGNPPQADGREASATLVEATADGVVIRQLAASGRTLLARRLTAPRGADARPDAGAASGLSKISR